MPGIDPSGPPSIGLDDSPHNELDLGGTGGSSLELDFAGGPGQGAPPASEPPPGIDMPDMGDMPDRGSHDAIDLPGPVGISAADDDGNAFGLDLPAPSGYGHDLPAPAGSRPPPPRPAPPSRPPGGGMPSFSADLPVPVELDLPTPAGSHQPDDRLDLPIPVDLPMPGGSGQMLTPAGLDVTPTNIGVTPTNIGVTPTNIGVTPSNIGVTPSNIGVTPTNLGVTPSNLGVTPSNLDVTPAQLDVRPASPGSSTPGAANPAGMELPPVPGLPPQPFATAAVAHRAPGDVGRPAVSRGLLIVVGAIAVLGLAGLGVLYSGVLDPEDPEPAAVRGHSGRKPKADDGGGGKATKPVAPGGPAVERSSTVLATMAQHTPSAYLEARAASTESGDAVGAAECGLLLHQHYGPNPPLANEALATLKAYPGNDAVFVQRVVGLAALATRDLAGAAAALAGDGPRIRLYRGWLHLEQGELDQAEAEAKAVLGTLADEVAARHLSLSVAARRDPVAAVAALQQSVKSSPHPALLALLAHTALRTGQLAIARTAVDAIDPAATDDPGVQAWSHVQRARVRAAQGDHAEALAAYDRALELMPDAPELQLERIRALLGAVRYSDASSTISALVRDRPNDVDAQLLQAEVAVHSGDGDIALQVLSTLAKALPDDARVLRLQAEVHAMRLAVEEAQAAFAAARKLDPTSVRIATGEAILLADAKRLPDALAVLEKARAAAEADGRSTDVADLLVAKAKLHAKAGERNAAIEALDRALTAMPTHNEAQLQRGILRLAEGDVRGRADLVAVYERTGGYPGLAGPLSRQYVLEGDYAGLEALVGERLRGDQTDDELLAPSIRLRLHQGRTEDARALVDLALARRPADWEVHMLQAQLLISEGKAAEALAEIEQARPPRPQPELMLQRGKILEFNARHDDAIPEYRAALELDPSLHEARFLFGRLLHHEGGHGKAITELTKVAEAPQATSAPWYPEVWLNIGLAQQAQGKYADAITSLKKATEIDPKLGEAWAKMGAFHENLNKHGDAIAALKKAVEIGSKGDYWYPDALMNLGRAQAKSGKKAAARATLESFLKDAPAESTSRAEAERLLKSL